MFAFTSFILLIATLLSVLADAAPYYAPSAKRQDAGRLVFAHFMMGIVPNRQSAKDYDADMTLAKSAGIDAFALNIGTDDYTSTQLKYAYESAANNDMKVFISFDFNWFSTGDAAAVSTLIKEFGSKPAQLMVDEKVFVSSFNGDGLDVGAVRVASGVEIYFAPNFHPSSTGDSSAVDGALNWMGWDSDGANRAPKSGQNVTVADGDNTYTQWLGSSKGYIAPISPWFNTHYGNEVSYPKNWVFPGDLLWYNRWNEILDLSPRFVEIITWNDYGESHYIGPLSSKHTDDGNSKWVNDMPHTGWLEMAKPFIAAYKAGEKTPKVSEDKLVYWYRPALKSLNCDGTDTVGSRPDGYDTLEDAVFVVALLTQGGKLSVSSGSNSQTFEAPAGASAWSVQMGVGQQKFGLERGGKTTLSATSLKNVVDVCPCGLYNFNSYVGTVPASEPDALDADGLEGFIKGLKVECAAKPSLPASAEGGGSATSTSAVVPASSSALNSTSVTATSPLSSTTGNQVSPSPVSTSDVSPDATPSSTTTVAEQAGAGGCTATVTSSSEVYPTNCLGSGQVWAGGVGGPDCCDGAAPCCR